MSPLVLLNAAVVAARRGGEILGFTLLFCSQVPFPVRLPGGKKKKSKKKEGDSGRENLRGGGRVTKLADRLL